MYLTYSRKGYFWIVKVNKTKFMRTVQDLIDQLMLVKDKNKEIRVVVNTNDYIASYPVSLFDMSIKEGKDIIESQFKDIVAIELYR